MKQNKEPRQYSLVKFDFESLPKEYHNSYPFQKKTRYIFLGDMPNMPGHCIVMDDNGKHYVGFHTDNFIELDDEYHGNDVTCEIDEYRPVRRHVGS